MTTRELRKALVEIEDQEITVKKLRELLYEIEDQDAELTTETLLVLTKKSSFKIEYGDEGADVQEFPGTMSRDEFFSRAAKAICFDDCGDYNVSEITFRGTRYYYSGWQPGMVYNFKAENGDEWEGSFPEWDH